MAQQRHWFLLAAVALSALAWASDSEVTSKSISIELVNDHGETADFAMRNSSRQTVAYFHWFSLDSSPVPYCKDQGGSVYICALKVMVDENDDPWTHEQYLKAGETVRFVAIVKGAAAV